MKPVTRYSTAIQQYPNGKFGIVGSMPRALTHLSDSVFPTPVSNTFDTEADAITALLEVGITRFQLASCAWYEKEVPA